MLFWPAMMVRSPNSSSASLIGPMFLNCALIILFQESITWLLASHHTTSTTFKLSTPLSSTILTAMRLLSRSAKHQCAEYDALRIREVGILDTLPARGPYLLSDSVPNGLVKIEGLLLGYFQSNRQTVWNFSVESTGISVALYKKLQRIFWQFLFIRFKYFMLYGSFSHLLPVRFLSFMSLFLPVNPLPSKNNLARRQPIL